MIADIIVDLQYGDCGKGKVTHHLCKQGGYTHVVRYNGGCNAGHTIYHEGTKFVTHHIPAGVFFGIKSVIGPGCVVNPEKFFKEIKELESKGLRVRNLIKIAKNCHVITRKHLSEDAEEVEEGEEEPTEDAPEQEALAYGDDDDDEEKALRAVIREELIAILGRSDALMMKAMEEDHQTLAPRCGVAALFEVGE